jgi:uncharacterized protein
MKDTLSFPQHVSLTHGLCFLGAFLAIGIALAGYFVSETMVKSKTGINTAEVKGLAERLVTSDEASWTVQFHVTVTDETPLKDLYTRAETFQHKLVETLRAQGFQENEVSVGALNYTTEEYRNNNQEVVELKRTITGAVSLVTKQVEQVFVVRNDVAKLIADDITIENENPRFRYTKLNEIKPEMLKEATQNARLAAEEFAKNADVKVGNIQRAKQGGFEIVDEGDDYNDSNKINKVARVVTTIRFYLTE